MPTATSSKSWVFVGIDPGIVHTGVVRFHIRDDFTCTVSAYVVEGLDVDEIASRCSSAEAVFIEAYRPRSHMAYDSRMVKGVAEIHKAIPGSKLINNTGVKKVIRQMLMQHLGLWDFPISTHHQDLRSAAYILLYGMVKNPEYNNILTSLVGGNSSTETPRKEIQCYTLNSQFWLNEQNNGAIL